MSQSVGYLIYGLLLAIAAVAIGVAVCAVRDCLARGDRQVFEGLRQMEAARKATPDTFTPQQRTSR